MNLHELYELLKNKGYVYGFFWHGMTWHGKATLCGIWQVCFFAFLLSVVENGHCHHCQTSFLSSSIVSKVLWYHAFSLIFDRGLWNCSSSRLLSDHLVTNALVLSFIWKVNNNYINHLLIKHFQNVGLICKDNFWNLLKKQVLLDYIRESVEWDLAYYVIN